MLTPRYGDEEGEEVQWQRWCRWLRTRSLSVGNTTVASIDPLRVAERIERFELKRWQRRYARDGRRFTKEPGRRLSGSLDDHFLQNAFGWLIGSQTGRVIPAQELETHRQLEQIPVEFTHNPRA